MFYSFVWLIFKKPLVVLVIFYRIRAIVCNDREFFSKATVQQVKTTRKPWG